MSVKKLNHGPKNLLRIVRKHFPRKNREPLEGRLPTTRRTFLKGLVFGTSLLLMTPFIPVKKVTTFFNPNYKPVVANVAYAKEKQPVKLPKETVKKAFEEGEKAEVKNITLEQYFKKFVKLELNSRLNYFILVSKPDEPLMLDGGSIEEGGTFSPHVWRYKKYFKEIDFLMKNGYIEIGIKEDFGWFSRTALLYLDEKGREDEINALFSEYKNLVESELSKRGINLRVELRNLYTVRFYLQDKNLTKEEKQKIAKQISEITADFMYKKISEDPKYSFLKEIYEDYLKRDDPYGFRTYVYSAEAPWGDEYTVVASIKNRDVDYMQLGLFVLKDGKLIAWDLQGYRVDIITHGKVIAIGDANDFPIGLGFMTDAGKKSGKNLFGIGVIISHENFLDRGVFSTIGIFEDLSTGRGSLEYISSL